jgi:type IV secretory pathway ATPase VirB11/archaellum biosynthesis ATPase
MTNPHKTQQKANFLKTDATVQNIDEFSSEEPTLSILVHSDDIKTLDVISGRGGKSNHHVGNKVFRHLVTEMKPAYRSSVIRTEKASLTNSIVEKVHRMGGRFLIQNTGPFEPQWRLMTKVEARRKTSQALRENRKLQWTYTSQINLS